MLPQAFWTYGYRWQHRSRNNAHLIGSDLSTLKGSKPPLLVSGNSQRCFLKSGTSPWSIHSAPFSSPLPSIWCPLHGVWLFHHCSCSSHENSRIPSHRCQPLGYPNGPRSNGGLSLICLFKPHVCHMSPRASWIPQFILPFIIKLHTESSAATCPFLFLPVHELHKVGMASHVFPTL